MITITKPCRQFQCAWFGVFLKYIQDVTVFCITYHSQQFRTIQQIVQGLRVTALCGAVGTAAGAWIKVFSVDPELFYVTFIGQTVVACSQVSKDLMNVCDILYIMWIMHVA